MMMMMNLISGLYWNDSRETITLYPVVVLSVVCDQLRELKVCDWQLRAVDLYLVVVIVCIMTHLT